MPQYVERCERRYRQALGRRYSVHYVEDELACSLLIQQAATPLAALNCCKLYQK